MLENILNNVNATEQNKSSVKSKNPLNSKGTKTDTEKNDKTDFKDILNKNLSENKPNAKSTQNDKEVLPTSSQKSVEKKIPSENNSLFSTHTNLESLNHKESQKDTKTTLNEKIDPNKSSKESHQPNVNANLKDDKKLSDIKTLGEQKNLAPKNIALQTDKSTKTTQDSQDKSPSKALPTPTQSIIEQKLKNSATTDTSTKKTPEEKPLATILKTLDEVDTKELKAREKFNSKHKIEYKTEGKTEKIAIIERGAHLPKNIVEPKIENAQKEEKLIKEQEKLSKTPQPLKEAISEAFVKKIKPKTDEKKADSSATQDSKETSSKKTKKPSEVKSSATLSSTQNLAESKPEQKEIKEALELPSKEELMQENNTQALKSEKTKKKQNTQEAQKSKEKTDQVPAKDKDSSTTLGVGALKNELAYKTANAKETIKNFAQNLQEEIKKFKPPMSKISLELYPEKLGKLELTIKQSGKNLQVNVVSNNQAIALFVQNQTELKQNLAMIGFSGVDLNFSSQSESSSQNNQDSNQQKRNKNSLKQYEQIKNVSEIPYDTMDLTLPKYA